MNVVVAERSPIVLTISRQVASGGAYIGQTVARRLGLHYVDREILQLAARELGVDDETAIEELEERHGGWFSQIARFMSVGPPDAPFVPPAVPAIQEDDVFAVESRLVKEIAAREDAVIVGRGAAHVLTNHPGLIRVFVHAPEAWRIAQAQRVYSLGESAARTMVRRSDQRRRAFVQGLIGRSWSDACLYDLTVDTSVVPMDLAADLLVHVVQQRLDARTG